VAQTFVLDTNVLLHDPRSLFVFDEHTVVIPIVAIEEIDSFKKNLDGVGANARQVSRYLDDLRTQGSLKEGIKLESGGTVRIDLCEDVDLSRPVDDRILQVVHRLSEEGNVVLVSRDTNMRIKCDARGIEAQDYQHDKVLEPSDDQYTGMVDLRTTSTLIDDLYADGSVPVSYLDAEGLHTNANLILRCGKKSALARVTPDGKHVRIIRRQKDGVWGILPRNKEQQFALSMLLDPDLDLVTLAGPAGTGKTLLAIACGLAQAVDKKDYRKLLVARPIFPMGRDIGYLPGDLDAKLGPWMKPIFDNLELLVEGSDEHGGGANYEYLFDSGKIAVEPLTYIRGRSIPNQYMIIDEAQNLTRHEIKTILTRAGEGTKIILTGDPAQIDNPYIDHRSNGLTFAIERFKDSPLAGHVTLVKGERSALADAASKLL